MPQPDAPEAPNALWPAYLRPPNSGPDCSAARSARLRERRFEMAYEQRSEHAHLTRLAEEARRIFLEHEPADPAMARAHPERHTNLMVRVAGYSARFIDLPPNEQDEIIGRSEQSI